MKKRETDFLIIGGGVAGIMFAYQCIKNNKKFILISDGEKAATHVAAGMFNPIVLKKFTPIWKAEQQMDEMKEDFTSLREILNAPILKYLPVYRILSSEQEKITWRNKREKDEALNRFLSSDFITEKAEAINSPFDFGEVKETGYVDFKLLSSKFFEVFENDIIIESFDFTKFEPVDKRYKEISFQYCVFAEGVKVKNNPLFDVKLNENKGEVFRIKTKEKLPNAIIKSRCFLMPKEGENYFVGATYELNFEDSNPTPEARENLKANLEHFFKGEYHIEEHSAAVRPTVRDRRPIVGEHHKLKNIYILNGMGTRGTFNAPFTSRILMDHILNETEIPKEINYKRCLKDC